MACICLQDLLNEPPDTDTLDPSSPNDAASNFYAAWESFTSWRGDSREDEEEKPPHQEQSIPMQNGVARKFLENLK